MCHSWIRNWGGLHSSLCKDGARPGPRSMTQRPSGRPPNERQPTDSHFCPSTGRRGHFRPTGLTAQKPTFDGGILPMSQCFTSSLNQRCPLFLVRLFLFLSIPPPSDTAVYFLAASFLGNLGWPMSLPRSLTLSTRSRLPRTFWSGVAVPRSKSATTVGVVLHLVASSFCVMVGV